MFRKRVTAAGSVGGMPATGPGEVDRVGASAATGAHVGNIVLAVLCAALLVAAAAVTLSSRSTASDATGDRAQALALDQERTDLATRVQEADSRRRELYAAANAAQQALVSFTEALSVASDSRDDLIDVENRAVDLGNQGHVSAAIDILRNAGEVQLADLVEKTAAMRDRLAAAEEQVRLLREVIDG